MKTSTKVLSVFSFVWQPQVAQKVHFFLRIRFVVRSSRQSENYKNLVAKNEDITYTRMYQVAWAENENQRNNGKDVAGINSPIEAHPREISSAFSSKKLSAKQKNILDKLPDDGSSATFRRTIYQ